MMSLLPLMLLTPVSSFTWLPQKSIIFQRTPTKEKYPRTSSWITGSHVVSVSRSGSKTGTAKDENEQLEIFRDFATFLQTTQREIISSLEETDGSGEIFTEDRWGSFLEDSDSNGAERVPPVTGSGGITRVIQGGDLIEKGACSLTLIQGAILSPERAASIRARNDVNIKAGDSYSAAALSIVLHTRSPLVPTFRSDVRVFLVRGEDGATMGWFGGGADLTPYYLFDEDIAEFHTLYRDLCDRYFPPGADPSSHQFSYESMKKSCDEYFYLPARSEHRGTGGIFFDDMTASWETLDFVKQVAQAWMPSWLPIVDKRRDIKYTEQQRQWQLLRRGRYLEFNLLYDRGVKFGLANANPRVEGIMVSAPPLIAWEYNHSIEEGSEEARMMEVLKSPRSWAA